MIDSLVLNVGQVNNYIKEMLDADEILSRLCIRGELSNYKKYPSGHCYFTLKDDSASIKCVMFRSDAVRLRFRPENGMLVRAAGRITVYPRDGAYQLYCVTLMPEGSGDLSVAFEQLKKKLSREGLFDAQHKITLPQFPQRIAVVTSSAGAVVHDILKVINQRFPCTSVLIVPVRVQGEYAAEEIAEGLRYVNRNSLADLIITGRGGGSLEDLWAFNEECVARAIFESQIPVISAVGHEPDVTIADYVADKRAATPSNAAEIAVPDRNELLQRLDFLENRMEQSVQSLIRTQRQQLSHLALRPVMQSPLQLVRDKQQYVDNRAERMEKAMIRMLGEKQTELTILTQKLSPAIDRCFFFNKHRLVHNSGKLDALSPLKVLARGYSIVLDCEDHVESSATTLKVGDRIKIRFADGVRGAEIVSDCEE